MTIQASAFSFRTSEPIKTAAFEVIRSYGMTPSQVFNMFLTEIANTKTIPLRLDYQPNARTLAAIEEIESGKAQTFSLKDNESLSDAMLRLAMDVDDE